MYLSKDVKSLIKPETIYGKQGDCVSVISYHGSVAIVENINGDRFPIMAEFLTGKMAINIELPDTLEVQPGPKSRDKKKVKRSTADVGSSLF